MVKLAETFFETKNDPEQLSVNEAVINRLREIHPDTLAEERTADGPVAWVLVIPTSLVMMERFLEQTMNERDLLRPLAAGETYEAIYLCSALVLPEFRRQGLARRLTIRSVESMRKDYPIKRLFYWAFSREGETLATSVAHACALPLLKRAEAQPAR
jgi:GNAT superfamily N-acetyltransferase